MILVRVSDWADVKVSNPAVIHAVQGREKSVQMSALMCSATPRADCKNRAAFPSWFTTVVFAIPNCIILNLELLQIVMFAPVFFQPFSFAFISVFSTFVLFCGLS
jgi:hypothetical protein